MSGLFRKRKRVTEVPPISVSAIISGTTNISSNASGGSNSSIWHSTPRSSSTATDDDQEKGSDKKRVALDSSIGSVMLSPVPEVKEKITTTEESLDEDETNDDNIEADSPLDSPAAQSENDDEEIENVEPPSPIIINQEGEEPPVVISSPSSSYFASVLKKFEFYLQHPRNQIRVDNMRFRKELTQWLDENSGEGKRIDGNSTKFIQSMGSSLNDDEKFERSISYTKYISADAIQPTQPSLVKCLLQIEYLQSNVIEIIFNHLSASQHLNMIDVDQIKNEDEYVDGLLNLGLNGNPTVQMNVVKFLPDILPATLQPQVVGDQRLMNLFNQGSKMISTLLDCFSCLNCVPAATWSQIGISAVRHMAEAKLADLPTFFSFFFRNDSPLSLDDMTSEIRSKVDLKPRKSKDSKGKGKHEDLIFTDLVDRVQLCSAMNSRVVPTWIKQVKDELGLGEDLKMIDLAILLMFFKHHEQLVTPVLMQLFSRVELTKKLLGELVADARPIMYRAFKGVVKLIHNLIRSKDVKHHYYVENIIIKLFIGLGPLEAQELMHTMTAVLVDGSSTCRDSTLKILFSIAQSEPKKMLRFAPFLMNALEYVMKFPAAQSRTLMQILARLAYIPEEKGNPFSSEFSILLRKFLGHPYSHKRSFGVLGAFCTIKELSGQAEVDTVEMERLLKMAWTLVERDEEPCRIFLDEFCECIDKIPTDLCKEYHTLLMEKYMQAWAIDASTEVEFFKAALGHGGLAMELEFDGNKEVQDNKKYIMVFESKPMELSPLVIPSHLRVLIRMEEKVSGNLEQLDQLLGSPIFFPSIERYFDADDISTTEYDKRYHLGRYLILTLNFFRELISGFVNESDRELRIKIWLRLNNVVELQKILALHLKSFPSLPMAYKSEETEQVGPSSAFPGPSTAPKDKKKKKKKPSKSTTKKVGKGKGKKKKKNDDDDEQDDNDATNQVENKAKEPTKIQPLSIVPYLRKFDTKVFGLLQKPLSMLTTPIDFAVVLNNLSSTANAQLAEIEVFNLETLILILTEITQQSKEIGNDFDILSVPNLVDHVCAHIDSLGAIYEGEMEISKDDNIEVCFRLLIETLLIYFDAIKNLVIEEKRSQLLEEQIKILDKRGSNRSNEVGASFAQIIESAATYLQEFVDNIKDVDAAVGHAKLLKNIHDLLDEKQVPVKRPLIKTVRFYLKRHWKLSSSSIETFIKIWFEVTEKLLNDIDNLITHIIGDAEPTLANSKDTFKPKNGFFKTCNKSNFHTWYIAMVEAVARHVYKVTKVEETDFAKTKELWLSGFRILNTLVATGQCVRKKTVLIPLLKHGRLLVETFTSKGIDFLPKFIKRDKQEAISFCKGCLNAPTRKLQAICEHSKVKRDLQLMKHVPYMKKALETLVFRVRELLLLNGIPTAGIWVGALRHRDLDGELQNSQPFDSLQFSEDSNDVDFDEDDDVPDSDNELMPNDPAADDEEEDSETEVDAQSIVSESIEQELEENEDSE